jgi:hypothetical protein
MVLSHQMLRRSLLGGAVCVLATAPALAQLQTTVVPTLPSIQADKDPADPDSLYCRPPQRQTDTRLLGPRVCKTNREWKMLHDQGLDVSADGKKTVASEKYRTLNNGPCRSAQDGCF